VPRRVTSFSNATIKRIRALEQKKFRRAERRFMAEGMRIVAEAVDAGHVPEALVFAEDIAAHPLLARLVAACEAAGGETIEVPREILHKITGKDNPQALVGVFAIPDRRLADLDRATAYVWTVCQSLKDPGNLGTILRTNDAVGAGGLILLDQSCDPYSVEAVRASMGALFTQPVVQATGAEFFAWLRSGPGQLVGASLNAARDYQDICYEAPTFVLMGNEQYGLPADYAAACDALVKIPMRGKADSLNVAVSCAVLLYEVLNQTRRGQAT
jgi:TrmH family RNA methyltransferase